MKPGNNPIERYKAEKDGLNILQEIEELAAKHGGGATMERNALLGEALTERGARVEELQFYQWLLPEFQSKGVSPRPTRAALSRMLFSAAEAM